MKTFVNAYHRLDGQRQPPGAEKIVRDENRKPPSLVAPEKIGAHKAMRRRKRRLYIRARPAFHTHEQRR